MSNELINALENRVGTAVETIENLRAEVRELQHDREILENKLRELLTKIDGVEETQASNQGNGTESITASEEQSGTPSSGFGFQRPGVGMDGTRSEY